MSFADAYLAKVSLDPDIVKHPPEKDLSIVVAIPASDEPGLPNTLSSLLQCRRPEGAVEIIVVINEAASASPGIRSQNERTYREITGIARDREQKGFRILVKYVPGLPDRLAGAGLARKIAMDHAVSRFNRLNNPGGIILSLDADTICRTDYLTETENQFRDRPDTKACNIRFEHPLEGSAYPEPVYRGIIRYELHLRYYIQALRLAGHPHAYHTVGSAFGVRADVYAAQGGMNKKKAGEDFYFLQKIIPLGGFYEVNSTLVMPSPRPSDRVGFGTGPVISKFERGEKTELYTYHPAVFSDLKEFLDSAGSLFHAHPDAYRQKMENYPTSVRENIRDEFLRRISEIRNNSASESTFIKRFYQWFNMFRTLKYINAAHRHHYRQMPVIKAARQLLAGADEAFPGGGAKALLLYYRKIQQG
jgi:hypothetical protein